MAVLAYLSAAVILGALVSIQPLMNSVLARALGSAYGAAAISIAVAFLGAVAMLAVTGRGDTSRAALASVPWWIYLAGLVGTVFVAGGVVIAPVTGALLFFACVVFGQLLGAMLADSAYGAAAISIAVAFLGAVAMLAVTGRGDTSRAALASVPWWIYLAGLVGTVFVAGGVVIAPVTGALLFFACVVFGQLLGAMLADHVGAFGVAVRPVSALRLLGLALVLGGAVLVQRG